MATMMTSPRETIIKPTTAFHSSETDPIPRWLAAITELQVTPPQMQPAGMDNKRSTPSETPVLTVGGELTSFGDW